MVLAKIKSTIWKQGITIFCLSLITMAACNEHENGNKTETDNSEKDPVRIDVTKRDINSIDLYTAGLLNDEDDFEAEPRTLFGTFPVSDKRNDKRVFESINELENGDQFNDDLNTLVLDDSSNSNNDDKRGYIYRYPYARHFGKRPILPMGFASQLGKRGTPMGFTSQLGKRGTPMGFVSQLGKRGTPMGFVSQLGKRGTPMGFASQLGKRGTPMGFASQLGKRGTPMGFISQLGKRLSEDEYERTERRAPMGFFSQLGKRAPLGFTSQLGKRMPMGFTNQLGKRVPLELTNQEKRAPFGFTGQLGKRAPFGFTGQLGKRAPLGFTSQLGKRAPLGFMTQLGKRDELDLGGQYGRNADLPEDSEITVKRRKKRSFNFAPWSYSHKPSPSRFLRGIDRYSFISRLGKRSQLIRSI